MVLWLKHDHHNIDISSQYVALTLCHDFSKNITYIYTIYFCNNQWWSYYYVSHYIHVENEAQRG